MKYLISIIVFLCLFSNTRANSITKRLQEVLDRGADLILEKGKTYQIDATLKLTKTGQQIYTEEAQSIRDYATIQIVNPTLITIINAEGIDNIEIKNIRIDGNRDKMSSEVGKVSMQAFISLGKKGGDDQTIKNCIITNARCGGGWAAIHVHEHAFRTTIQDNIIFGSGTDVLGNGRSMLEYPFGWGDGISVAARNSIVRNNLIIDATDEGIMVQGAPGTKVENNVIVALSRELLGGIALIDPADYCLLDSAENLFDYRGVEVKNNWVHSLGGRVHIAYPCGMEVWNNNKDKKILQGAEVVGNKFFGKIGGYGFAVSSVKDFRITDNTVNAVFEERGDGLPNNPPDDAVAFIYDAEKTINSKLQKEFVKAKKHIVHLLRNFRKPVNEAGYRLLDKYGTVETKAIIDAAYMEMLGRFPSKEEMENWENWFRETRSNADAIRTQLMTSPEFQKQKQPWRISQLQECRVQLFMEYLYDAFDEQKDNSWPNAGQLHKSLFSRYEH